MKKLCIFFIIIFVILCMSFSHVSAVNISMDLPDDNEETNASYNEQENNVETSSISSSDTSNTSSISNPQIAVTSSRNNEFLTIENILSVTIIVIGIILIFLGIAIIIRCK